MATQTGSISFEATSAFSSYASGEYATKEMATRLQTSIEQNADAITLRATKAELDALSIGGRNRLVNTGNPTADNPVKGANCRNPPIYGGTVAYADGVGTYTVDSTSAERCVRFVTTAGDTLSLMGLPKSGNFVFSGYVKTSFDDAQSRLTVRSQYYAGSWKQAKLIKNLLTGEELFGGIIPVIVGSSSEWTRFEVMLTIPDGESPTGFYLSLQEYDKNGGGSTAVAGDTFQFKSLKFEKGDRATDWSPAPEDMATAAELKVANDAIALKVSKNDVINQINVSTEGATIAANRVNIEGATIFTNGRLSSTSLNNAYDAKGAASAVQDNLDNLAIGGTNLLGGTANPSNKQVVVNSAGTSTFGDVSNYNDAATLYSFEDFDGYSNTLKWTTSGTGNRGAGWYTKVGAIKAGERYTFSCKVMSSVATTVHTHTAWRNGSATANYTGWTAAGSVAIPADEWTDYSYSFEPHSSAKLDWEFYVALCFSGKSGGATFRVAHAKLEHGNRATDWNPAPEDIEANAVKRTQRIWWRATESGAPSKLTTWLATSGTGYGNWSLSVPKLTNGTTKYPFLYTAVQTQTVAQEAAGTACSCSDVLLDENTTVIDGGTIITGSVHANSLDADSVKANIVQATDLSASKITSGDIATERMSANVVSAVKAKVSDLYALVAKIGGFVINATSIFSGAAVTSNADNAVALSTADFTRTVNGASRTGLRFAIGSKFGVEGDGTLYANGANVTSINADNISSGSIGADRIKANVISAVNNGTGTINADKVNVSAIKIGDLDGGSTVVSNASNGKSAYDRHTAYRGTCSTAAGTAAKVVACTGFALATGATVEVYCSTANTADVPTLNVNSTGAKPIWINGAVASASNPCKWLAGDTVTFTYDGTRFRASLPVEGYVTEGTGGGLMVHRKSDVTTGVQITDSVEILQGGTSVAEYGATARIGEATKAHIEQTSNKLSFFASDGVTNAITMTTTVNAADGVVRFPGGAGIISANDGSTLEDDSYISLDSSMSGYANVTIAAHSSAEETWILVRPDRVILRHIASEGHIEGAPLFVGELSLATPLADTYIASVSASKLSGTIADANLPTKGSAGTAGTSSATSGATLAVPYITTDAYGRVTAKGTHTHTIGSLAASAVTSGAFDAARIPNLNASKINAGTFDAARIPSLNASKINAGTLNSARLPTVPVDKGGTGQTGVTTVTNVASFIAAASGVTVSSVRVTVWGKLVHAYVTAKPDAAKTSAWTVGTVVSAYRPNAVVTGKPYYTGVDSARIMMDGTMQITACGAVEVGVSFTYLLA